MRGAVVLSCCLLLACEGTRPTATDAPLPDIDAWSAPDAGPDAPPRADAAPFIHEVVLEPTPENSSGVKLDDSGDLVLDTYLPAVTLPHIWIANSGEHTVSKIDTNTGVELGRYRTGPGSPDPSRTTVGLDGDVVVANRNGSSAVRIHADAATCPDADGDGVVETSTGGADVLAWGEDECVLWYHAFAAGSIARAAAFDWVGGPDGELSYSVWIGLYGAGKVVRLDATTGEQIAEVLLPGACPYGMAFDGAGLLWIYDMCNNAVIDIKTSSLTWGSRPTPCGYGITVDSHGNVWTAGGGCVSRYTPSTSTWQQVGIGSFNRGLAHDGAGSIWVADTSFGVHRIADDTVTVTSSLALSGSFVGMAVDFNGQIWAVSEMTSQAYRIDPATLAWSAFPTGSWPYTYSDMTGFQLQNAAPPLGLFRTVIAGCGPTTEWQELDWSAITPFGTSVRFRARTANSELELWGFDKVPVAVQPEDVAPIDLAAALEAGRPGSSYGSFLELEMVLSSTRASVTPTLEGVTVTASCPVIIVP